MKTSCLERAQASLGMSISEAFEYARQNGMTMADCAEWAGVAEGTWRRLCRSVGLPPITKRNFPDVSRYRPETLDERARRLGWGGLVDIVMTCRAKGGTLEDAARLLGSRANVISETLKQMGVELPPRGKLTEKQLAARRKAVARMHAANKAKREIERHERMNHDHQTR